MLTGRKRVRPGAGIARSAPLTAWLLLASIAAFWGYAVFAGRLPFGLDGSQATGTPAAQVREHGDD